MPPSLNNSRNFPGSHRAAPVLGSSRLKEQAGRDMWWDEEDDREAYAALEEEEEEEEGQDFYSPFGFLSLLSRPKVNKCSNLMRAKNFLFLGLGFKSLLMIRSSYSSLSLIQAPHLRTLSRDI